MKRIDCFIPYEDDAQVSRTLESLSKEEDVAKVVLVKESLKSTSTLRYIASVAEADYSLIYTKYTDLSFGLFALERMLAIADDTGAAMVYADHFNEKDGIRKEAPVIDYQMGSLRDDFDFGSVLLYRTSALKDAIAKNDISLMNAAKDDLQKSLYEISAKLYQQAAPQGNPQQGAPDMGANPGAGNPQNNGGPDVYDADFTDVDGN